MFSLRKYFNQTSQTGSMVCLMRGVRACQSFHGFSYFSVQRELFEQTSSTIQTFWLVFSISTALQKIKHHAWAFLHGELLESIDFFFLYAQSMRKSLSENVACSDQSLLQCSSHCSPFPSITYFAL